MEANIPPLDSARPLREEVREVLEDLIVHRSLPPGAHLREEELARRLGVSRSPVREALRALERDGWVDVRHRHGAFVPIPDPEQADQMFEVRRMLESEASALAARRISAEHLAEMDRILAEGRRAVAESRQQALVDLNTQFHRSVAAAAGNRVLVELLARLEKRVVWYFSAVATVRSQESWQEHEELVAALRGRDPEEAARLMASHTEATRLAYRRAAAQPLAALS